MPAAQSALAIGKCLLQPGERVDFALEEFNVFLEGSGWVGVTPVRSFSLLGESAVYLDFGTGEVVRENLVGLLCRCVIMRCRAHARPRGAGSARCSGPTPWMWSPATRAGGAAGRRLRACRCGRGTCCRWWCPRTRASRSC